MNELARDSNCCSPVVGTQPALTENIYSPQHITGQSTGAATQKGTRLPQGDLVQSACDQYWVLL